MNRLNVGVHGLRSRAFCLIAVMPFLIAAYDVRADFPLTLSDRVRQGEGTIDLLRNIGSGDLASYFNQEGQLYLAVDLNETVSGLATRDSIGVAIQHMELVLQTTAGTYTFSDFFTTTTAMIVAAGETEASEFYTLFGRTGSSGLTGRTGDSALDRYDDVVEIRDVVFEGEILAATVYVKFLDTADTGRNTTEEFFQYSNGFEEFALIGRTEAVLLETAGYGVTEAPEGLVFNDSMRESFDYLPGTPAPPALVLAALAGLLLFQRRNAIPK